MFRHALACLVPAVLWIQAVPAQEGPAAFEEGMKVYERYRGRSDWVRARAALSELLAAHEGKPYVLANSKALLEDIKRLTFRVQHPPPDPKSLIAGDVLSLRSGKIKIRYTKKHLKDFRRVGSMYIHPAVFEGSYTITGKGNSYPSGGVAMVVCFHKMAKCVRVGFGRAMTPDGYYNTWVEGIIEVFDDEAGDETLAQEKRSPLKAGQRYTVVAKVGNTIELRGNGKRFIRAKRPIDYGSFGLFGFPFQDLVVEGKVSRAWVEGLVDRALAEEREKFDETYKPQQHAPKWLLAAATDATPAESTEDEDKKKWRESLKVPGRLRRSHFSTVSQFWEHMVVGNTVDARKLLDSGAGQRLPEVSRSFLMAYLLHRTGDHREALPLIAGVLEVDAGSRDSSLLHARILLGLRLRGKAQQALQNLIAAEEDFAQAWSDLAVIQLLQGQMAETKKLLADARAKGVRSSELTRLERNLLMAEKGPLWPEVFVHKTRNYQIATDMDQKAAREAGLILENALRDYQQRLQRLTKSDGRRFRVFLFSGQAGYDAYVKDIVGQMNRHTAGLYSGTLKQLLIWNQGNRDFTDRTVRHEGFHQYLDRLINDPPVWLNEGMAEYFETMDRRGGRLKLGEVRKDHLVTLLARADRTIPLGEFVRFGRGKFYQRPDVHYAQGWAVVHFLMHGGRDKRKIFDKLFAGLLEEVPADTAIDKAFEGVDMKALHDEFVTYLEDLRK